MVGRAGQTSVVTPDEIIAYQQARYVVASAATEKVRRHGGSPRTIAEAFDAVELSNPEQATKTGVSHRPDPRQPCVVRLTSVGLQRAPGSGTGCR